MNWWLTAMKKYVDFSGRARRTEYWMFMLFNMIFGTVAFVLDILLSSATDGAGFGVFYSLFSLAIMIPSLSVTVRRLHDVGKSGWWILISLIPFIGGIWLFVLTISASQPGENAYGSHPKVSMVPVQV
jgi:uncharacterized membrane protein YhaH (DUF805 family)